MIDYLFYRTLRLMIKWGHRDRLLLSVILFLTMAINISINGIFGYLYAFFGYRFEILPVEKNSILLLMFSLAFLQYFYFVYNKRYLMIIRKFSNETLLETRKRNKSTTLLFVIIYVFGMASFFLMMLRNRGQFGFFLN